jgi:hypothetical protein
MTFSSAEAMENIEFGGCLSRFEGKNLHIAGKVVVEARQVFAQALMVDFSG